MGTTEAKSAADILLDVHSTDIALNFRPVPALAWRRIP
jgi:hypothetical protein